MESPQIRDWTQVSCIGGGFLSTVPPEKSRNFLISFFIFWKIFSHLYFVNASLRRLIIKFFFLFPSFVSSKFPCLFSVLPLIVEAFFKCLVVLVRCEEYLKANWKCRVIKNSTVYNWPQSKWLSTEKWINKLWFSLQWNYLGMRINTLQLYARNWVTYKWNVEWKMMYARVHIINFFLKLKNKTNLWCYPWG